MSKKKHLRCLAAAVVLGISGSLSLPAAAQSTSTVSSNSRYMFSLVFFDDGEGWGKLVEPSTYTLPASLKTGVEAGVRYWADLLSAGAKNSAPVQILVRNQAGLMNASAGPFVYHNGAEVMYNYTAQGLQQGKSLLILDPAAAAQVTPGTGDLGGILITVGQYIGVDGANTVYGWYNDADTVLPTNEQSADFIGTIRHEMAHALGIGASTEAVGKNDADNRAPMDVSNGYANELKKFNGFLDDNSWMSHLQDQNGNRAAAGKEIVTSAYFSKLQAANPSLQEKDYFIMDNIHDTASLAAKPTAGHAYFVGDEVTKALDGKTFEGVSGIPVNAWEPSTYSWTDAQGVQHEIVTYVPELSHMQTSGMMSHASYGNYTGFMEVELAAMQDMGYKLDRRNYYGFSVYRDGAVITNTQGYSARDAAGENYLPGVCNTTSLGIGLHVYGSNNTITQQADILTRGTGAAGMRIDGEGNKITLAAGNAIHADGTRGIGALICYGRNQQLVQNGTITADGPGGNGVQFDFGSSGNGASDQYRGSYINYLRRPVGGKITEAGNSRIAAGNTELDGPLVLNYDIAGSLSGAENAIYISRNAFVKDIHVLPGADIRGNITSDWKHFAGGLYDGVNGDKSDALKIQYAGGSYDYDRYIPDLVTKIHIGTDLAYSGNIMGADNLRLQVDSGTLQYSGTANIVSAEVAAGAKLIGGDFTVNDMSSTMAAGFSDTAMGRVINHGTIGAATPMAGDTVMKIAGRLESDGTLQFTARGKSRGLIQVTGSAAAADNRLSVDPKGIYLPKYAYDTAILSVNGADAGVSYSGFDAYATGMMTAVYGNGRLAFQPENHLGAMDDRQSQSYGALSAMYDGLTESQQLQVVPVYNLSAPAAREALTDIAGADNALAPDVIQQSALVGRSVSSRLTQALARVQVPVGAGSSLTDGTDSPDGVTVNLPMTGIYEYSSWLKYSKDWGELGSGDARYHSSGITLGFDKQYAPGSRVGGFLTYNVIGYGATAANQQTYDWRLGLYGGWHNGAKDAYAYLDYGWQRNHMQRAIRNTALRTDTEYTSRLIEAGGEYKYDLTAGKGKIWHVSPYAGTQVSYYQQPGYAEAGAGALNQQVSSFHNTYAAAEAGVELKRELVKGSYTLRAGCKRVLAGDDPEMEFHYEGDAAHSYRNHGCTDRMLLTLGLSGEHEFAPGWKLSGDLGLEKGSHDKEMTASVTLRHVW